MACLVFAVVCTMIREARCSMMISYSLFKYMVLYGYIGSVVSCIAFFVASTQLTIPQVTLHLINYPVFLRLSIRPPLLKSCLAAMAV